MEQKTRIGMNKTGADMSPLDSKKMQEASECLALDNSAGYPKLEMLKQSFILEAESLGTVPVPGTATGLIKTVTQLIVGNHPEILINKLGERLAFERSGVRIYEQLILKCEQAGAHFLSAIDLSVNRLRELRHQELEHFLMLVECCKNLGVDPTAQTPDADASGVAAMGLLDVIADPRTTISQSLEAMLSLELTDNAAWKSLVTLAEEVGLDEMAAKFRHAANQENAHVEQVTRWYNESVRHQLKLAGCLRR